MVRRDTWKEAGVGRDDQRWGGTVLEMKGKRGDREERRGEY